LLEQKETMVSGNLIQVAGLCFDPIMLDAGKYSQIYDPN
jgi:hypothetical protein